MSITTTNVFQLDWPEPSFTRDILENLKNHFGGSVPDAADGESVLPLVRECVEVLIETEDMVPLFHCSHLQDRDARSYVNRQIVRVDPPTFEVIREHQDQLELYYGTRHTFVGQSYIEVIVRRRIAFHPTEMKKAIKTITVEGVEYQNASMERVLGPLKETEEVFSVFAYPKTIRVFSAGG